MNIQFEKAFSASVEPELWSVAVTFAIKFPLKYDTTGLDEAQVKHLKACIGTSSDSIQHEVKVYRRLGPIDGIVPLLDQSDVGIHMAFMQNGSLVRYVTKRNSAFWRRTLDLWPPIFRSNASFPSSSPLPFPFALTSTAFPVLCMSAWRSHDRLFLNPSLQLPIPLVFEVPLQSLSSL